MALTGWLETDNLLAIIALLLGTSNFYQARIKSALLSLKKFVKADIEIRARLEAKANYLMRKMGVDIEAFDATVDIDFNGDFFDD